MNNPLVINLFKIIRANNFNDLKDFLDQNPNFNLNVCNDNGENLLHAAIRADNCCLEIVKKLIEKNVDVNAVDNEKNTPLHEAVRNCNFEAIKELISAGAHINIVDQAVKNPFDYAEEARKIDINRLVREFIEEQRIDSVDVESVKDMSVLKNILNITKRYVARYPEAVKTKLLVLQTVTKIIDRYVFGKDSYNDNSKQELESVVKLALDLYSKINPRGDVRNNFVSLSVAQYALKETDSLNPALKMKLLSVFVSDVISDPKLLSDNVFRIKFISALGMLAKEDDIGSAAKIQEHSIFPLFKEYCFHKQSAKRVVKTSVFSTLLAVCVVVSTLIAMLLIGEALLQPYVIAFGALAAASVLVGLCGTAYFKLNENQFVYSVSKLSQKAPKIDSANNIRSYIELQPLKGGIKEENGLL